MVVNEGDGSRIEVLTVSIRTRRRVFYWSLSLALNARRFGAGPSDALFATPENWFHVGQKEPPPSLRWQVAGRVHFPFLEKPFGQAYQDSHKDECQEYEAYPKLPPPHFRQFGSEDEISRFLHEP